MLPCCFYHPVLALHIFSDYNILVASLFQNAYHYACQVFMDLRIYVTAGDQSFLPQPGDGMVEDAGIVIAYEEGEVRLMIDDMRGHGRDILDGDIGRVANQEVQGWQVIPFCAIKDI